MNANASNGFGKRKPAERKPYVAPEGSPTPTTGGQTAKLDLASITTTPPTNPLSGIMFGLAIVFCLGAGYFIMMKGFGRALDQHWRENVGFPGIEDAYKRTVGGDVSLEWIHNDCKSRSDFVSLDRDRTQRFENFDPLHSGELALSKAALYVSCLTGEKPERFCQAAHRTHLIAALKDYFQLMGRVREARVIVTSGPLAAARMNLLGTPGREQRPATPTPSAQTDERVVAGLRILLQGGHVSRRDLAPVMGPPGDLELALRGVEPRRTGCT